MDYILDVQRLAAVREGLAVSFLKTPKDFPIGMIPDQVGTLVAVADAFQVSQDIRSLSDGETDQESGSVVQLVEEPVIILSPAVDVCHGISVREFGPVLV